MTAVELYQREATLARREWGDERLALVVATLMRVPDDTPPPTPAEVDLFAARCRATGMDPLANQIHAVFRKDRRAALGRSMTIQAGIDGIRAAALRTGQVTGSGPPEWLDGDGTWRDAWPYEYHPAACRWTVKRDGHPFTATLNYREYVQTYDDRPQGRWVTAGADQLRKCAEAAALRMAFAETLGGVYEPAELDRADAVVPDDVKAGRAAEADDRAAEQRIGADDAAHLADLARAARLTRGEVRGILEDIAGVGRLEHVRRRDLAAVRAALVARTPKDSAPPGAPNVGTPEVIPADEPAADGDEIVEPDATGPVADTGEPDAEAGTSTSRGDSPPDPAQPRRRRERKPKPAAPVAADPPPPDDTPADADPLADAFQPPTFGRTEANRTPPPLEPLDDEPAGFGVNPHGPYGPGAP